MKCICLWQRIVPSLVFTMLLTSCGQNVADRPGTPEVTPNSTSSAYSADSQGPASAIVVSPSTTPPQATCAAFLPSAPCTTYTSISGTTNGQDIPWVTSSLKAALVSVDGQQLLVSVRTGCGPLSGTAQITGNTLTVTDIAIGASGCTDATGEQQSWAIDFLKRPIEMTFSQGTLLWKSGTDSLSFKGD
jgi:heat shock protein HslJ